MADENLVLLRLVQDAILSFVRQLDGGNVSEDMTDYLAFRLDQLYGHILRLTAGNPNLREVEPLICKAARSLRILVGMSSNDCYELPLEHSGHVGRPRFGVSSAQLEYLLANKFLKCCQFPCQRSGAECETSTCQWGIFIAVLVKKSWTMHCKASWGIFQIAVTGELWDNSKAEVSRFW